MKRLLMTVLGLLSLAVHGQASAIVGQCDLSNETYNLTWVTWPLRIAVDVATPTDVVRTSVKVKSTFPGVGPTWAYWSEQLVPLIIAPHGGGGPGTSQFNGDTTTFIVENNFYTRGNRLIRADAFRKDATTDTHTGCAIKPYIVQNKPYLVFTPPVSAYIGEPVEFRIRGDIDTEYAASGKAIVNLIYGDNTPSSNIQATSGQTTTLSHTYNVTVEKNYTLSASAGDGFFSDARNYSIAIGYRPGNKPPANLRVVDNSCKYSHQIAWNAVSQATSYRLHRLTGSPSGASAQVFSGAGTTYISNTLPDQNTNYYFKVQSCTASKCGPLTPTAVGPVRYKAVCQ